MRTRRSRRGSRWRPFDIGLRVLIPIGFAALTMNADLTFSASVSGLGAVLFFLTYVALEVPSNLALDRYGARRSPARLGGEDETATAPTAAE